MKQTCGDLFQQQQAELNRNDCLDKVPKVSVLGAVLCVRKFWIFGAQIRKNRLLTAQKGHVHRNVFKHCNFHIFIKQSFYFNKSPNLNGGLCCGGALCKEVGVGSLTFVF